MSGSGAGGDAAAAAAAAADAAQLGRLLMADFLRSSRAYDILPESNKVVVFDVTVPVRLAFYALVEHGASRGGRARAHRAG